MKRKKGIYILSFAALLGLAACLWLVGRSYEADRVSETDSAKIGRKVEPVRKNGKPLSSESIRRGNTAQPVEVAAEAVEVEVAEEVKVSKYAEDVAGIAADLTAALMAGDTTKAREFMRQLSRFRRQTLRNALRGLIHHGTPEQRKNALYALALAFGEGSRRIRSFSTKEGEKLELDKSDLGTISDGEPEAGTLEEREAKRSYEIVNAVGEGLKDADATVKEAAFEAMRSLAEEESGILSQQLLCGDDSVLKQKLLEDVAGSTAEQDLKISIAALENADAKVREMAEANVKEASGKEMKTQEEAMSWMEARTEEAIRKAQNEVDPNGSEVKQATTEGK